MVVNPAVYSSGQAKILKILPIGNIPPGINSNTIVIIFITIFYYVVVT